MFKNLFSVDRLWVKKLSYWKIKKWGHNPKGIVAVEAPYLICKIDHEHHLEISDAIFKG